MTDAPHSFEELRGSELFSRLWRFGQDHDLEEGHALQVTRLSLELFDLLAPVHRLGPEGRKLLFAAALLHDVGLCRGLSGHHKSSLELMMAGDLSPLNYRERKMAAGIARYHRKAHPRGRHAHYSSLEGEDRLTVARAASILRMADALDRAHDGAVRGVGVQMSTKGIVLRAAAGRELDFEEAALRKKARLFEELFGLPVSLETVRDTEGR